MFRWSFFQKIDQTEENSGNKIIENLKGWEKSHNSIILELQLWLANEPHTIVKNMRKYTLEPRNVLSPREKENYFPMKGSIPTSYQLPVLWSFWSYKSFQSQEALPCLVFHPLAIFWHNQSDTILFNASFYIVTITNSSANSKGWMQNKYGSLRDSSLPTVHATQSALCSLSSPQHGPDGSWDDPRAHRTLG